MTGKEINELETLKVKRWKTTIPPNTVLVCENRFTDRHKVYMSGEKKESIKGLFLLPWTKANFVSLAKRKIDVQDNEFALSDPRLKVVSNVSLVYSPIVGRADEAKPKKKPTIAERWKGFINDFKKSKAAKIVKYSLFGAAAITAGVLVGPLLGAGAVVSGFAGFGIAAAGTAGYVSFARQDSEWAANHGATVYTDNKANLAEAMRELEEEFSKALTNYYSGLDPKAAVGKRPDPKAPAFDDFADMIDSYRDMYGIEVRPAVHEAQLTQASQQEIKNQASYQKYVAQIKKLAALLKGVPVDDNAITAITTMIVTRRPGDLAFLQAVEDNCLSVIFPVVPPSQIGVAVLEYIDNSTKNQEKEQTK